MDAHLTGMAGSFRGAFTRGPLVAVLGMAALLGGCSGSEEKAGDFEGPYGSELRAAYESASDPAVRAVLEDGRITRAEYDAALQRFVACAADRGVTVTLEEAYGLYTFSTVGDATEVLDACSPHVETIAALYGRMLTNPDNRDMDEVVVECLRRAEVVSRDYTAETWVADRDAGTQPFSMDAPAVIRCLMNPQAEG